MLTSVKDYKQYNLFSVNFILLKLCFVIIASRTEFRFEICFMKVFQRFQRPDGIQGLFLNVSLALEWLIPSPFSIRSLDIFTSEITCQNVKYVTS